MHADFCDEPKISLEMKEAIYRIVQEALNNIATHAQATLVRLELFREDGKPPLEVNDNGIGFDQSTVAPGHFGLRSMGERAAHLGGLLLVESAPGVGTTIHVQIRSATDRLLRIGPGFIACRLLRWYNLRMNPEQERRYSRRILLSRIGLQGQQRLAAARARAWRGALGSSIASSLVRAGCGFVNWWIGFHRVGQSPAPSSL